ncbi:MAG: ABC transporter permease [Byssovorax sp.]
MNPLETLRIALRALLRNKTRSSLTALGIIIGVAAVIAVMAIGEGAKKQIEGQFAAMGTNLLILQPGSSTSSGVRGGSGSSASLTWDDLKAIQTQIPSVTGAAPSLRSNATLVSEEQNWTTSVIGTTPDYFVIRNWPISHGTGLSESDVESGTKVVVLGATVADKLFGQSSDPIGQSVRIKNIPFQVIGVAGAKGQSAQGQDYDDTCFVPSSTFQTKIQGGLAAYISGSLVIAASSGAATTTAQAQITDLLRERHHTRPGADDDFSIRNLAELASAQQEGTKTMTTLLASVAAVSLLVGGIGIMNIMLVSVTERTREIGIRLAVGAQSRHILTQFLMEALALAVGGGLLGVGIGVYAATRIADQFGWPVLIRPDIVLIAVAFSGAVGIVFGLYPARKASRLDPIQALRFE